MDLIKHKLVNFNFPKVEKHFFQFIFYIYILFLNELFLVNTANHTHLLGLILSSYELLSVIIIIFFSLLLLSSLTFSPLLSSLFLFLFLFLLPCPFALPSRVITQIKMFCNNSSRNLNVISNEINKVCVCGFIC